MREGLGEFAHWVVRTAEGWREMAVEEFALHSKGPVARLAGCADRTAAERLRGCEIAVPRAALGEAREGTHYQVDLVGLEVRDTDGNALGTVDGFVRSGEASVMVVKGGAERLIPFVDAYVKAVDREARPHHGGLEGGLRRMKHFDVVTIFPEMLEAVARHGITRRALEDGLFGLKTWDPRDFTTDAYRRVDDRPYGGGPGMVMMAEPLDAAIVAASNRQRDAGVAKPLVILTSPQGERLTEHVVRGLEKEEGLVIIAGRYEGVDERLVEKRVDREISIGDYVTSGGELPAMVLIDCLVRRLPGSLNDARSSAEDSFSAGLLDWPHYTRPEAWKGAAVPEVLVSGNHAVIARWRRMQALGRTWERRPELVDEPALSKEDRALLDAYRVERSLK